MANYIVSHDRYVGLRDKKGVTDYDVALATNIPKSTFSEWKADRSAPKTAKLKKIADYFGVSIEDFLVEVKDGD